MLAKSTLVRAFPSWFETTSQTVNILSEIPVYGSGSGVLPGVRKEG